MISDNEETLDDFSDGITHDVETNDYDTVDSNAPEKQENWGEKREGTFNYVKWTNLGDGIFTYTGKTVEKLPPAVYTIFSDPHGIYFRTESTKSDDIIEFKDSIATDIMSEVELFWDSKGLFKQYGFLHRRGYFFYGPAGCGKSGLIYMIIHQIIKRGGIVILVDAPDQVSTMVKIFRQIEPDRHIVCIFEDIDAIIKKHGEAEVLSFLDGETQLDDILNIATSNYPERLDKRIVARPRRFDRRIKIEPPIASIRREFFTKKLQVLDSDIEDWVSLSDGFTFAAMADLVIQVKCLSVPLLKAADNISKMMHSVPSSNELDKKLGF